MKNFVHKNWYVLSSKNENTAKMNTVYDDIMSTGEAVKSTYIPHSFASFALKTVTIVLHKSHDTLIHIQKNTYPNIKESIY
jgi:hypothetical protein